MEIEKEIARLKTEIELHQMEIDSNTNAMKNKVARMKKLEKQIEKIIIRPKKIKNQKYF